MNWPNRLSFGRVGLPSNARPPVPPESLPGATVPGFPLPLLQGRISSNSLRNLVFLARGFVQFGLEPVQGASQGGLAAFGDRPGGVLHLRATELVAAIDRTPPRARTLARRAAPKILSLETIMARSTPRRGRRRGGGQTGFVRPSVPRIREAPDRRYRAGPRQGNAAAASAVIRRGEPGPPADASRGGLAAPSRSLLRLAKLGRGSSPGHPIRIAAASVVRPSR